ncbi:arylsulfatase I [Trichonephila inaurata madagascariensis]|uniref:Arylsulfatase I n=1 Tax=Trichonephila inaurata madagascariensis TaxID=2747483 RepID=A0A8X7BRY8_9ARAC|nr:arylsulfatase I [Trichonephila inaurata madagascariensis]
MYLFLIPFLLLGVTYLKAEEHTQQPNIVLILADDLGYNDVSYNGYPQITTPNIDALALNGIILRNYYGEWLCTPSRGSLFTGKYASRLGLQHSGIKGGEDSGLPLDEITLAQRLKKLGYDTYMIGKWHLGYSTKDRLPTFRGFDSFFGYLNGLIGYYDHTYCQKTHIPSKPFYFGKDLYNGSTPVKGRDGEYATRMFTEQAEHVILSHDTSKPLFMYMAQIAPHKGNFYKRLEAPEEAINKFKYIEHMERRIYAGGDIADLGPIDGNDMWDALVKDSPSPRTHALLNLDPIFGTSSFRSGDMKLVNGTTPIYSLWRYPNGIESSIPLLLMIGFSKMEAL